MYVCIRVSRQSVTLQIVFTKTTYSLSNLYLASFLVISLKIEYSVNSKTQVNVYGNRKKIKINVVFVVLLWKNKTHTDRGTNNKHLRPVFVQDCPHVCLASCNLVRCLKLARTTTATPLLFIRNIWIYDLARQISWNRISTMACCQ